MILTALLPTLLAPVLVPTQGGLGYAGSQPNGGQSGGPPIGRAVDDAVPFMHVRMGDLAAMAPSPKDAGLRRVFALLDDRLADLPQELGREMPPEAAQLFSEESLPVWLHLLSAQKSFSMGMSRTMAMEMGNPMVGAVAIEEADAESAAAYAGQLDALLERMGAPVPPGLYAPDGNSVVMRMGMNPPAEIAPKARALAGRGGLVSEMSVDVGAMLGFFQGMVQEQGAPPEAALLFDVLHRLGLHEMKVELAQTSNERFIRTTSVMSGLGKRMRESGILPAEGIQLAHLAPIPADATMANVSRFDMGAGFEALNALAAEIMTEMGMEGSDPAAQILSFTGIDLREGLFGALGDTMGYYSSMTTGGGGLTSTVVFFSLRDADALTDTKEHIEGMLNGLAASETYGYVSIRPWMDGETEYTSLMFPGLPVPLEPTIAMDTNWLVVAATPQAARAAMAQIQGGGENLGSRANIASLADGTKNGIGFVDTAYFSRIGYGPVCLVGSALANAVRSPRDDTRDAGPVVPLFNDFQSGIAPTVTVTEVLGDDLVSVAVGDSSNLVQFAMVAGILQEYMAGIVGPIAMAAAAEELEREMRYW